MWEIIAAIATELVGILGPDMTIPPAETLVADGYLFEGNGILIHEITGTMEKVVQREAFSSVRSTPGKSLQG